MWPLDKLPITCTPQDSGLLPPTLSWYKTEKIRLEEAWRLGTYGKLQWLCINSIVQVANFRSNGWFEHLYVQGYCDALAKEQPLQAVKVGHVKVSLWSVGSCGQMIVANCFVHRIFGTWSTGFQVCCLCRSLFCSRSISVAVEGCKQMWGIWLSIKTKDSHQLLLWLSVHREPWEQYVTSYRSLWTLSAHPRMWMSSSSLQMTYTGVFLLCTPLSPWFQPLQKKSYAYQRYAFE